MTDSFDLTSRPWIVCERLDGTLAELSTRDVLVEAHRLRAIIDESPLVVAVLHRHLIAVVHRVVDGPRDFEAWAAIAQRGHFEAAAVEAYLNGVRDRMDLFHPTRPFAQVRGLTEVFPDFLDPIDELGFERSAWGGARKLFQHRPPGYVASMSPAEAARALLAHHAFATGGLVRKPNEPTAASAAPLVRAAVVLLRGETLFETLISNLLYYEPKLGAPIGGSTHDAPGWEQDSLPRALKRPDEPKRAPAGWLDLLTWQSRRIELVREGSRVVSYVRAVGQGLAEGSPLDPMVTWRLHEEYGFVSIGINPNRAFWRDSAALFESARGGDTRYIRPKAVEQAASIEVRDLVGNRAFTLDVSGLAAKKSLVETIRVDRVWARASYFNDPTVRQAITGTLEIATLGVSALGAALRSYARHILAEGERSPDVQDIGKIAGSLTAEPQVWSALSIEFDQMMRRIDSSPADAVDDFARRTIDIVRRTFERATAVADGTARSLKARALGAASLERGLAALSTHNDSQKAVS